MGYRSVPINYNAIFEDYSTLEKYMKAFPMNILESATGYLFRYNNTLRKFETRLQSSEYWFSEPESCCHPKTGFLPFRVTSIYLEEEPAQ